MISRMIFLIGIVSCHLFAAGVQAAETLPGEYQVLHDESSLHSDGKVLLVEFADFYCPHCHLFDRTVASTLDKEFGDRLEVRLVGFPVIRGPLPTAFAMYEQARMMGKGSAMKTVLFRTIHDDKVRIFNKNLRRLLLKEIGLDRNTFEAGLASGEPYKAFHKGKTWGVRVGVTHTPTVVLDGNLKIENLRIDNFRTIIKGILKNDGVQQAQSNLDIR